MVTGTVPAGVKPVIFTDLDGTLLDAHKYSYRPATAALGRIEALSIPLVVCTSKTSAEILHWRDRLANTHPFVSENGGGVYIPKGYFRAGVPGAVAIDGYHALRFGTSYPELRRALEGLRADGFDLTGFGDMTADEVAAATGLPLEQARMAKEREYDEPFFFGGDAARLQELFGAIERMGLAHTAGRILHLLGDNNKGRAVGFLAGLYRAELGDIVTAALGDSANDAPMLAAVDYPFLVRKPEGRHDPAVTDARVERVGGIGPEGWAEAVEALLDRLGLK